MLFTTICRLSHNLCILRRAADAAAGTFPGDFQLPQRWNDEGVPVTHPVTTFRRQTTETSAKVKGEGELAKYLTQQYGFSYVYEVYWKLNQVDGPYELPAH